ncbi:MAG TPA: MobF family relaxase [Anaeromyxobacteraceae bacterium]|nr:MobF family relaxase [Anaeromyxobacteraceae bacterium]
MLTQRILSRQKVTPHDLKRTARYYERLDDLFAKEGMASAWQGKGAAALKLKGVVEKERLCKLLAGKIGRNTARATRKGRRSIGVDLTFSAPKSVSLQALVGGDPAIVRAHDLAVERALKVAEKRAQTCKQVGGRRQIEQTGNLIIARFRHETSREQDPHLHTHALVLNLTRRHDGQWRALKKDELLKTSRYFGALYRAELAAELQRIGYALHPTHDGFFELEHFDPAKLAAFSQRSEKISNYLATKGRTKQTATPRQKWWAKILTRPDGAPVDRQAVLAEWLARAQAVGFEFGRPCPPEQDREIPRDYSAVRAEAARRGVKYAIGRLTARQAIVEERKLVDLAKKRAGEATLREVEREIDRQIGTGYLIRARPLYRPADAAWHEEPRPRGAFIALLVEQGLPRETAIRRVDEHIAKHHLLEAEPRYTTKSAQRRERRMLEIERAGRGQMIPFLTRKTVRLRLDSTHLDAGERAAIELMGTTRHRVVGVQGGGNGKSHLIHHARAMAEAVGHRVVALTPDAIQLRALRARGVEARSPASFVASRARLVDSRTVLVIDQASSAAIRHLEHALNLAEEASARVVLLGNAPHPKTIETGRPFDDLKDAGMQVALQRERQFQKDPMQRENALAAKEAELDRVRGPRDLSHDRERDAIARDDAPLSLPGWGDPIRTSNTMGSSGATPPGAPGGSAAAAKAKPGATPAERAFSRHCEPASPIRPEEDEKKRGLAHAALHETGKTGTGNPLLVRGEKELMELSPKTRPRGSTESRRKEFAPDSHARRTSSDAPFANGDFAKASPTARALVERSRRVEPPEKGSRSLDHTHERSAPGHLSRTTDRALNHASKTSRARDAYQVESGRTHEARVDRESLARRSGGMEMEGKDLKPAEFDLGFG